MAAEEVKKGIVPAGRWAFLTGVIISVISAWLEVPHLSIILFLLGLVVGAIHVREGESASFLTAVISLVIVGIAGTQFGTLTTMVETIFKNFTAFTSAAALIVALRQIFAAAKP
jgi:hypothetical protein